MGFANELGSANDDGTHTTLALTIGATAPGAGSGLLLSFGGVSENVTPSSVTLSSVSDSKGNTWVIDVAAGSNTAPRCAIARTQQDVGTLVTGDTITITVNQIGGQQNPYIFSVHEITGIVAKDVTASGTNSINTTARTAGTTAAIATAVEFVWAAFAVQGVETNFTPVAGYSQPTTKFNTRASISIEFEYKTTSVVGTQNPTGTGGLSAHNTGVVVAYSSSLVPAAINATSAMTATLTAVGRVVPAAINATSAVAAGLSLVAALAAAAPATSSVTASLSARAALAPVVVATSAVTATLTLTSTVLHTTYFDESVPGAASFQPSQAARTFDPVAPAANTLGGA